MVKRLEQNMGADAMAAATGRTHEQWRAILLGAGARQWSHSEIARHLMDAHGVDGWWAQGITVDFEQAHQGRLPGQRADGTFAVSRTQTVPGQRLDALATVADAVTARHGRPHGENLTAVMPVVRWRLDDGTRLAASAQVPNKSGTPVNLTWERLSGPEAMEDARAAIDAIFAELA